MFDERLEPNYNEKVDREIYEEVKEEQEEDYKKRIDAETQRDDLVATILEYGNKYDFAEAYAKIIEYLKGEKLI